MNATSFPVSVLIHEIPHSKRSLEDSQDNDFVRDGDNKDEPEGITVTVPPSKKTADR